MDALDGGFFLLRRLDDLNCLWPFGVQICPGPFGDQEQVRSQRETDHNESGEQPGDLPLQSFALLPQFSDLG
jgi:hypothetical protein